MRLMHFGVVGGLVLAIIAGAACVSPGDGAPAADAPARPPCGGWVTTEEQGPVFCVAFNPSSDRLLVVVGPEGFNRIQEVRDGTVLAIHKRRSLKGCDRSNAALYSNDGKSIASAAGGREVEEWDPASGETVRRLDVGAPGGPGRDQNDLFDAIPVAFSPDDRLLAVERNGWVQSEEMVVLDRASGKKRFAFPLENWNFHVMVPILSVGRAAFRPGGKELAVARFTDRIGVYSLETGEKVRELKCPEIHRTARALAMSPDIHKTAGALAIAPDGRTLAAAFADRIFEGSHVPLSPFASGTLEYHAIPLWNLSTGQHIGALKGHWDDAWSVAYSADGRLILSGGADKTIRLWEALSGQELNCWDFDRAVNYVTMSPDGKKVAAALFKGNTFTSREWQSTVACFPIERPVPDRPAHPPQGSNLSDLWADLAAADAKQAYKAVQAMTDAAEATPKWLRERLRTVPRVPAAEVARLITDLDADAFDRREAATKALAALGAQAGPALRKTLDETDSPEVRSRVKPLVQALDEWVVTDPDTLRALRAIWVLERVGTPEARAVLEDLAKGAPEVRQTQEAKSALDFLDRRAAARPDQEAKP